LENTKTVEFRTSIVVCQVVDAEKKPLLVDKEEKALRRGLAFYVQLVLATICSRAEEALLIYAATLQNNLGLSNLHGAAVIYLFLVIYFVFSRGLPIGRVSGTNSPFVWNNNQSA
jgi:hypothetical protein